MVRIGMLRQFKKSNNVVLAAALAAHYYGMEFFFFRPENVDFEKNKINGMFYEQGSWISKKLISPMLLIIHQPETKIQKFTKGWKRYYRLLPIELVIKNQYLIE